MARILVIAFHPCPASDRAGVEAMQLLAALGPSHHVEALVPRDHDRPFFEALHHARVLRVPLGAGPHDERSAAFTRAAARQLAAEEYDVAWLRSPALGPLLGEALPAGTALVVEPGPGDVPAAGGPAPWWSGRAAAVVVRTHEAAARCRGPSSDAAAEAAVVHVVPPAVDVDRFDRDHATPGPPRLMACGGQDLEVLAAAVALLEGGVRLVVPGEVDVARRQALADCSAGRCDFPGLLDPERMPALHASTVAAISAAPLDELGGPPLTLLEAMACGNLAAAPVGGVAVQLLDAGRAGLLLPAPRADRSATAPATAPAAAQAADWSERASEIAAALAPLLLSGTLRGALGEEARARVRDDHTASARRRTLRSIVDGLAPSRR